MANAKNSPSTPAGGLGCLLRGDGGRQGLHHLRGHSAYLSHTIVNEGFILTEGLWDPATGKITRRGLSRLPGHGYVTGFLSRDGLYVRRSKGPVS